MGQALYRKHRSRSLDEIIGQEHITDTLSSAIKQGRISHAYLLTGPRGVGKTSIARILAHEINNLPYSDDTAHMDIIEIDAASNRRIDEIRELRERVSIAPTSAKYKVYIIDEVHMLTKEAFNALLKTLEEPPAHAVFILATTDAHKLPDTIISRTQRYNFKPVQKDKVINHLKTISKQENIKISDEALGLLAEHGEGSFRDSISLLDQASSNKDSLELADIQRLLGIPSNESISSLINMLGQGSSAKDILGELQALYGQGYQPSMIAKQMSALVRLDLISQEPQLSKDFSLKLLERLITISPSHDPIRLLELQLLEYANFKPTLPPVANSKSTTVSETTHEKDPDVPSPINTTSTINNVQLNENSWAEVLGELKQKHNTLYGVVRMAQPNFEKNDILTLSFAFAFHQKRCNESSNRQKLSDIILNVTGSVVDIQCMLDPKTKPPKIQVETKRSQNKPDLAAISNIFGEAELLES